ncbi:acetyltransferase [Dyadobacter sp. 676]|uniref:Acetyltransferase n=1 Tax=Dyadobacter sp. 676 TaxID=3088362 RepID=A0AAU8FSK6_9BACT
MLIYGAGGHARVILSILRTIGKQVSGIFDDNWQNIPVLASHPVRKYQPTFDSEEQLIVAIGDNQVRRRVASGVIHSFGQIVHPAAIVDSSVSIGPGVVIIHNAVIQAGCCIGDHVVVNTGAIVDHECILEDFVHVGPAAVLCGGVRVGECTLVGAGSVVVPGVRIGRECLIGAGSVVVHDVPDHTRIAGNPGKIIL